MRKTTELFDAYEQIWAQRATQIAEIIGEKEYDVRFWRRRIGGVERRA